MLFAETGQRSLFEALLGSGAFGILGIGLLIVGYILFDVVTKKIDVQEQLNKGNMAIAIVVSALLLSIAYIVTHVVI